MNSLGASSLVVELGRCLFFASIDLGATVGSDGCKGRMTMPRLHSRTPTVEEIQKIRLTIER